MVHADDAALGLDDVLKPEAGLVIVLELPLLVEPRKEVGRGQDDDGGGCADQKKHARAPPAGKQHDPRAQSEAHEREKDRDLPQRPGVHEDKSREHAAGGRSQDVPSI